MTAVITGSDPSLMEVVEVVAAVAVGGYLGILLGKVVLWFHTPATQRPRRRPPRSAAVSPVAAGPYSPAVTPPDGGRCAARARRTPAAALAASIRRRCHR